MPRLRPTEQARSQDRLDFLLLAQRVKLPSGVALPLEDLRLAKDTNLATDRLSGVLVVAGNDDNADPSRAALDDGAPDLGPRRIQHADEADKGHVLLERDVLLGALRLVVLGVTVDVIDDGEREGPEALPTVREDLVVELVPQPSVEGDFSSQRALNERTAVEDRLGSTLDEERRRVRGVVPDQDRHALAVA